MTGIRLLISPSAVQGICRVVVGLLVAGCVLIGCAALARCSDGFQYDGPTERDRSDENTRQCFAMGGAPVTSGGQWYRGCDFPPTCPPCPRETPAEAPEGGRP